jgi:hypothetical protein
VLLTPADTCLGGCKADGDCSSGLCQISATDANFGTCVSCADTAQTGTDTDIDCGGQRCGAREDGLRCVEDTDCLSPSCHSGQAARTCVSCSNGKNGARDVGESDLDCGGPACRSLLPATADGKAMDPFLCGDARACEVDGDCASRQCTDGGGVGEGEPGRALREVQRPG